MSFSQLRKLSSLTEKFLNFFIGNANALNIADVAKVIVFSQSGYYHISDVKNGAFSVDATKNEPVILVFAGVTNNYLGYYALPNGLESIPLINVKSGTTTIDLGNLSSVNKIVGSSKNPLDQTDLDSTTKDNFALSGKFFSSLAKNVDADANGVIDVLENKYYRIHPLIFATVGNFNSLGQVSLRNPIIFQGYKFAFDFSENNSGGNADTITINGGAFTNSQSTQKNVYDNRRTYFSSMVGSSSLSESNYTIAVGSRNLTFQLPAQSNIADNILIPIPTLEVDSSGVLKKITISSFKNTNGDVVSNPSSIISDFLQVQIEGSGTPPCANNVQGSGRLFNSDNLATSSNYSVSPACDTLLMSKISRIFIAYTDHFANHYPIQYEKAP